MARMGRDDWLALGLRALAEGGEPAIRLEAITARAGKTRGSFYHHFSGTDAFVADMIDLWRRRDTEALIEAAESSADPAAALNALAATLDLREERAIRRLAEGDPARARLVAEVDAARIAYLRRLKPDPLSDAAADYALVEYAAFLGLQILAENAAPERLERLGALIADMIEVHWNE